MAGWKDRELLGRLGVALTIPVVLATGPLAGYLVGSWLDRRWGTAPWALGAAVTLGFIGSGVQVYRMLQWIAQADRTRTGKR